MKCRKYLKLIPTRNGKLNVTKEQILKKLCEVMDPEIPRLSVIDLGVIVSVDVSDSEVKIKMTPTFAGCPAINYLRDEIRRKVQELGVENVIVDVTFEKRWTSDMITESGRKILKESRFALPRLNNGKFQPELITNVECPICNSTNTRLQTPFGPTLCRAIHYCDDCKQAFEQFKPVQ